jgi:4-amino-4-deoxychorismate lyase
VRVLALAVGGRGVVDPAEPVLHADDEGFARGRAAFETIRVYEGRPFRLNEHLKRLAGSAARLGLAEVDEDEYRELVDSALGAAGASEAMLRLYLTAGRQDGGGPGVRLAMVSELPADLDELRARGLKLISAPLGLDPDLRAKAPWLLGGVKSTSYAVNMAAQAEAERRGADDAVFVASGGIVLEGPTTNVWWRLERALYTPALELGILAGVTRAVLVAEATRLGYEVREGAFPLEHMAAADEVFTSSSVREVMAAVELDGLPLGDGRPGPSAAELQKALRATARRV